MLGMCPNYFFLLVSSQLLVTYLQGSNLDKVRNMGKLGALGKNEPWIPTDHPPSSSNSLCSSPHQVQCTHSNTYHVNMNQYGGLTC